MIKTTRYAKYLTITTDDDGNRTVTTSSHASTETAYRFSELTPEAQARAISDAIEEETDPANWWSSQAYFAESEIIDAARDLEKSQPVDISQDAGCSWYGTARGTYWYHPADWQSVAEQQHTGICYSMDICDVWNAYAVRIVALQEAHEEAEKKSWTHEEAADNATDNGDAETAEAERRRAAFYDHMAERIENAAEELTEEAARRVGDVVDGLIEGEREYYQSADFWRYWLEDSYERYTRDGSRY